MKITYALFLIYFLSCPFIEVFADFRFSFDKKNFSKKQEISINFFLEDVANKLPKKLKEGINRTIPVTFEKLDSNTSFPIPQCPKDINEYKELIHNKISTKTVWARSYSRQNDASIVLNTLFLAEIVKGEEKSIHYNCQHENSYRMAQAQLIHEVTHIYDRLVPFSMHVDQEKLKICRNEIYEQNELNKPTTKPNHFCPRIIKKVQRTKTDWRQLKTLSDWTRELFFSFKRHTNNNLENRSPNRYEYTNERESLAVNMEYWLLDPSYFQRRPALATFFDWFWQERPRHLTRKPLRTQVSLFRDDLSTVFETSPDFVDFDPKKVFEIQLLSVDAGQDLQGHFGHSMMKIILCPTEKLDPHCLAESDNHIILTVAADNGLEDFSYKKFMQGDYQAKPYLSSFDTVLQTYTKKELRSLSIYPLKLNRFEITLYIYQVLEDLLAKHVTYDFIQRNCATRQLTFLKGAVSNKTLQNSYPLSPHGLVEALKKSHVLVVPKKMVPYYWPSNKNNVEEALHLLKQFTKGSCPVLSEIDIYHCAKPDLIEEFVTCYKELYEKNKQIPYEIQKSFFVMGFHILRFLQISTMGKISSLLANIAQKENSLRTEDEKMLMNISAETVSLIKKLNTQYDNNNFIGYGIPIYIETKPVVLDDQEISNIKDQYKEYFTKVYPIMKSVMPKTMRANELLNAFLVYVGNECRKLIE